MHTTIMRFFWGGNYRTIIIIDRYREFLWSTKFETRTMGDLKNGSPSSLPMRREACLSLY